MHTKRWVAERQKVLVSVLERAVVVVMAQEKSTSPNAEERAAAMKLGKASANVSAAGIIVGLILLFVFVILVSTGHYTVRQWNFMIIRSGAVQLYEYCYENTWVKWRVGNPRGDRPYSKKSCGGASRPYRNFVMLVFRNSEMSRFLHVSVRFNPFPIELNKNL